MVLAPSVLSPFLLLPLPPDQEKQEPAPVCLVTSTSLPCLRCWAGPADEAAGADSAQTWV